jgi:hypothetical protein
MHDDRTVIPRRGWDNAPDAGPNEAPVIMRLAVVAILALPVMVVVALAILLAAR